MYSFHSLNRAHGEVQATGVVKQLNEDFVVDEIMPVQPLGSGEHLWLHIRKSGCNTDWLARRLADVAEVKPMAVSYAGLKDRQAVTTQWFSIHLPGREDPDLSSLVDSDIQILQSIRHDRKLRRGALSGNRFQLRIRHLQGSVDWLENRLRAIAEQGVPNYFGEQRFGHDMGNLEKAEAMFAGRLKRAKKHQRSLYLSAARSWIFNEVLSQRVSADNWNQYLAGDVFQLAGKSACFADDGSEDIVSRLAARSIHPTGPLWGRGQSMAEADCLALEMAVASGFEVFCHGLENAGLKQERRALRLMVENLHWQFEAAETLIVNFELPAGAYATMVLREFIEEND